MDSHEMLLKFVEYPEALDPTRMIFTPKEVMDATGITKGALTNRAYRMGIKRKGFYTFDEVARILSKPLRIIRSYDAEHVETLQALLMEKFKTKPTAHAIEHRWPYGEQESAT